MTPTLEGGKREVYHPSTSKINQREREREKREGRRGGRDREERKREG